MANKILIKGNEALCEGSIEAGCKAYFGYPITPQNEIPAYMSERMEKAGGVFIQAESELASINMVFGASAAGARAMTSSSSPGISLMQEGISYLAGCELPCLIINVMRGGPGLGNISGSQSDYFQSTRGGGHGDYRTICLAPNSCQEMFDLPMLAFHLADKYRNPAMIIVDGVLGQIMEGVDREKSRRFRETLENKKLPEKNWKLDGCAGRGPRLIRSLIMEEGGLEEHNYRLQEKYRNIAEAETLCEEYNMQKAEVAVVAYGIASRTAKEAIDGLNKNIGLIRPVTLWPFPKNVFEKYAGRLKNILVVEYSSGQMIEDVLLAVNCRAKVDFLGKPGGGIITPDEITEKLKGML